MAISVEQRAGALCGAQQVMLLWGSEQGLSNGGCDTVCCNSHGYEAVGALCVCEHPALIHCSGQKRSCSSEGFSPAGPRARPVGLGYPSALLQSCHREYTQTGGSRTLLAAAPAMSGGQSLPGCCPPRSCLVPTLVVAAAGAPMALGTGTGVWHRCHWDCSAAAPEPGGQRGCGGECVPAALFTRPQAATGCPWG